MIINSHTQIIYNYLIFTIMDKKNINHIVILDNIHIKKEMTTILHHYPFMLSKYDKVVNLNIHLITTYPKIKVISLNKNKIFTEFRKVINNKTHSVEINDMYSQVFSECIKLFSENSLNEIVMFTNMMYYLGNEAKEILTKMSNNASINIICNYDFINLDKINIYQNGNEPINQFYENIIKNGIFLQESFPVKSDNDISNLIENVNNEIDNNNIIDAISFFIDCINKDNSLLNNTLYQFVKNKLLEFVNCTHDDEIKNKSILLYQEFKKHSVSIVNNEINKLNTDNDNIKMIIEYGKKSIQSNNIFNTKIIKNMNAINKNNNNFDVAGISEFIKLHENGENGENENNEDNKFDDACEFFNSSVTLSNWFEELQNNSCIGLLLKLTSTDLAKMGIICNNINIQNITTSYLSIADYINTTMDYFDKNKNVKFGDLNKKNIITGMAIGEANAVIPIYINKYHWKMAKNYIEPLLGIIMSHNPFNYTNEHKSIFYTVFVEMTYRLFRYNKEHLNNKYIKTYFAYLRTCAELCFENKYNHGIKKLISSYTTDPLIRISKNNYPYDKICSQTLVTGCILPDDVIKTLILYQLEELIRINIKLLDYDDDYIDYLLKLEGDALDSDIDSTIQHLNTKMPYDIEFLMTYYKMNKIISEIIKSYGSYGKFIRTLDDSYSLISDDVSEKIFNMINYNLNPEKIQIKELYELLGVNYNKYNIIFYILQGIKHKKNKDRIDAINNKEYIDPQKVTIDLSILLDKFKTKIEN